MASVYSMAWIFLRTFPVIIGKTDNLYVYGYKQTNVLEKLCTIFFSVITLLVEMNSMTNAFVYLVNNGEVTIRIRRAKITKILHISDKELDPKNDRIFAKCAF